MLKLSKGKKMIRKFTYGKPYPTEATTMNIQASNEELPIFICDQREEEIVLLYKMENEDVAYGLGENLRGINKRGYLYTSFCSDDASHTEEKTSLYGAHNFLIMNGKRKFGIFIDCPEKVTFDIGYSNYSILQIKMETKNVNIFIIEESKLEEIVHAFRMLIGESYIPPKWAFGYQQSRWGYKTQEDIVEVAHKYRELELPIDAIYLDIDYMENFKNFTIDTKAFPDFEELVEKMKAEHIRLVPIIDAGVKIEKEYEIYEEGIKGNYFCTNEDGKPFVAAVWPGKVHFPDFLNPDARKWFGYKYKYLLDMGIEGFWNDMNEPAIFYSENGLQEAFIKIDSLRNKNIGIYDFFALKDTVLNLSNAKADYKNIYHKVNGKKICHYRVHNLYGYNMTKGASESFEEFENEKRLLLFSRASSIGMHRYGGIWTGDNNSWWQHLLQNIKMMPSLNMCGFLYTGADTGGFGCDVTYDLLVRWLQFSIFTPLLRNHAALGTRKQELYEFEDQSTFKKLLEFRYSLIPYLYSEYIKAAKTNTMLFRPLAFAFEEDVEAKYVEDQILLGDEIMLAPIYTQNAVGRYVYLPEEMVCIRVKKDGTKEGAKLSKGHHYIHSQLEEFAFFIRKNHFIVLGNAAQSTDQLDEINFEIIGDMQHETEAQLLFYQDDGYTKNIAIENATRIIIEKNKKKWEVVCENKEIIIEKITIY